MIVFFFNDTATTEIYTLSLHDALPICETLRYGHALPHASGPCWPEFQDLVLRYDPVDAIAIRFVHGGSQDRKSTRLNSSHANISYAVFCLKKKNTTISQLSLTSRSNTL